MDYILLDLIGPFAAAAGIKLPKIKNYVNNNSPRHPADHLAERTIIKLQR